MKRLQEAGGTTQGVMTVRRATPAHPGRPERGEIALYWRGISKRRWWVLGVAFVVGGGVALALSFITPIYRATATLLIEQNKANLVPIEEVYSAVSPNREHYYTQARMLTSPGLAERVVDELALITHPEFDPRQQKPAPWTGFVLGPTRDAGGASFSDATLKATVVADFVRRITVEPVRLTQLVKVGFDSAEPELAARIANKLVRAYIDADVEMRSGMRQRATDWLVDRLSELKANLENSERALQKYRENEVLPETKGLAQGGAVKQIEVLGAALAAATEARTEAEASYKQIKAAQGRLGSLPIVLRNTGIDRLKDLEAQAEKRQVEVTERYGPQHPRFERAQADLVHARENTRSAMERVVASFEKDFQIAVANERAASRTLAAARGSVQKLNRKEFQLDALEQDLTTNRLLYEKFMSRYRETRAATDSQSSAVARVIDPAITPVAPHKPRKEQIVVATFMSTLLLAAILASLRERSNLTVKTADEVEEKLGLPTLAVVPLLKGHSAADGGLHYLDLPDSAFSEALRTARTGILLSSIDAANKVLLVTSSCAGEGKTTFALNLALAHAETAKTLLIEADLRRPSLRNKLSLRSSQPGLSRLCSGTASFLDCIHRVDGSSLYVLPCDSTLEDPLELFASETFQRLIAHVTAVCDVVIIDSPPVQAVSDALVLSTLATGVVFVIEADATPYPIARRCIRALREASAPILGVVLNQVAVTKTDRSYGAYSKNTSRQSTTFLRAGSTSRRG